MTTPKEYAHHLKDGEITEEMLSDCLFSVNKRAKNYRDKQREYRNRRINNRYYYDKYGNERKNQQKKEEMYNKKELLLSILKPICIHKEPCKKRIRVYDYEPEYDLEMDCDAITNIGSYLDYLSDDEVMFYDKEVDSYNYYLYYELGTHSFHTPISNDDVEKSDINVVTISELNTCGDEIKELISMQFVDKILNLIASGNYKLIMEVN